MDEDLVLEIEGLRKSKTKAMQRRYCELFGEETTSNNRAHLFRRIAWRLQARESTGLSERAQQRVTALADLVELRRRAPPGFWRALERNRPGTASRDPRLPPPGTRLTRSYQNREIVVEVLEKGFSYEGAVFLSLSAIARHITGTRWNGFLFFGIQKDARRD